MRGHELAQRPWIPYHENLTPGLAALAGARAAEVVAMNSLTVNLHLMLATFYRPRGKRRKILIEAGAFPPTAMPWPRSSLARLRCAADALIELAPRRRRGGARTEEIEGTLQQLGAEIALVLWPGVQYRTGQAFDLARIARAGAPRALSRRIRSCALDRQRAVAAARGAAPTLQSGAATSI